MTHVYDKAKWHYDGDFPAELDIRQGFVHTGLFVTWLANARLLSDWLEQETPDPIAKARSCSGDPIELYNVWGGALADDMLSEAGNASAREYFDFGHGDYINDYVTEFRLENESVYCVDASWENYRRIAARIDQAYDRWLKSRQ